jgi:hypothetical protein
MSIIINLALKTLQANDQFALLTEPRFRDDDAAGGGCHSC